MSKNPLDYVIRESPDLKKTADDSVTNYDTQEDELISRITHSNTTGDTVD